MHAGYVFDPKRTDLQLTGIVSQSKADLEEERPPVREDENPQLAAVDHFCSHCQGASATERAVCISSTTSSSSAVVF
jgi:hypothetical protein